MAIKDLVKKAAEGDADALKELADLEERASYLDGELKKAIKARDDAKGGARMSKDERDELDTLRAKAAEAEEAQLKAKGDFETLKKKLEKQIADAEAKAEAAAQRFANKAIETAFAGAAELFGATGRTTLTPDFARKGFAEHVKFLPGETGDGGSVVVHDLKGVPITAEDGKPVPFAEAMGRLIDQWPTKEAILRGGQRAGSGSTGAGSTTETTSATRAETIKRAATGDPDAIKALHGTRVPGQPISGRHWDRQAEAPAK